MLAYQRIAGNKPCFFVNALDIQMHQEVFYRYILVVLSYWTLAGRPGFLGKEGHYVN